MARHYMDATYYSEQLVLLVGSGNSIPIIVVNWLQRAEICRMRHGIDQALRRVSEFFRPNTRLWDRAKLREWLGDDMGKLAEELRPPKDDKLIWLDLQKEILISSRLNGQ